jgi:hypothetical protein
MPSHRAAPEGSVLFGASDAFGAAWVDLPSALDPSTYGTNVEPFANAMQAVDSTIKVGAVPVAPGNWPGGETPDWNSNVLATCGTAIDFVNPSKPGNAE